jgi:hypothetical protein
MKLADLSGTKKEHVKDNINEPEIKSKKKPLVM